MLSNQKSSRFYSVKGIAFTAIALALLMSVTAFASGNSRFAFIDSATEFFGLQSNIAAVTTAPVNSTQTAPVSVSSSFANLSVGMPSVNQASGVVSLPVTVGDTTGLGVISFDMNVDFNPLVIVPTGSPFTQTGTLSGSMVVNANATFPGHLIISAFQGVPIAGPGTLIILNFNIVGTAGQSSTVVFADYTDPSSIFHAGIQFNDGDPAAIPVVNGNVNIPAATATNTNTPTPSATNTNTPTNTPTPTNTATNTNTPTPSNTATATATATSTPLCAQIDIADVTTTSGSSVTLGVSTSNTTSLSPQAYSADFRISYDNTILSGVPTSPYGVALGPVGLSNSSSLTVNRQISGSTTTLLISVFTGDTLPFNGSGDLVTITFPTVTGGAGTFTPVNFTGWPQVPAGFWYNEGNPSSCLQNGSVQILGTVSGNILYDNTMPGAPFTRPVPQVQLSSSGTGFPAVSSVFTDTLGNYTLSGFGSGVYNVSPFRSEFSAPNTQGAAVSAYDAAITAQKVVELITFTAKQNFVANVTNTGQVSSFDSAKMAQWAVGIIGSAPNDVGKWRFAPAVRTYTSAGSLTGENYLAYLMGDPSGNWCDPTTSVSPCSLSGVVIGQPRGTGPQSSTVVKAQSVSAQTGGTVVVPVNIERAAGKGIISYQFDLRYDPKVIEPTANAVTLGGTVSGDMNVVFNPAAPGLLRVAVYGPYAMNESGLLLNFHFNAVGEVLSSSPIMFENFMFNEGGIATITTNGRVSLTPVVPTTAAE